jgi:hypothetical protein
MAYYFTEVEPKPHALPYVEVFTLGEQEADRDIEGFNGIGWYYAFGQVGCLWDSAPVGPYNAGWEALKKARLNAGTVEEGCGEVGIRGFRCTEHFNKMHIARSADEIDEFAESWPIEEGA